MRPPNRSGPPDGHIASGEVGIDNVAGSHHVQGPSGSSLVLTGQSSRWFQASRHRSSQRCETAPIDVDGRASPPTLSRSRRPPADQCLRLLLQMRRPAGCSPRRRRTVCRRWSLTDQGVKRDVEAAEGRPRTSFTMKLPSDRCVGQVKRRQRYRRCRRQTRGCRDRVMPQPRCSIVNPMVHSHHPFGRRRQHRIKAGVSPVGSCR